MAVGVWEPIDINGEAAFRTRYRAIFYCRASTKPDTASRLLSIANKLERFQGWIDVTDVKVIPLESDKRNGRGSETRIEVYFQKIGPGSPLLLIIGLIILAILIPLGIVVVSKTIERYQEPLETVGLPVILLAGIVAIVYFKHAKG